MPNVRQRFRRVEELLGASIDGALTDEHFQRLVDAKAGETDDLEFKVDLYAGETGKAELAKDVAALANHVGGVIIVGVADVKGTASAVMPVDDINDGQLRRVRSVVANRVHPFPAFDVLACRSATSGKGFLLIVVGRSPLAPHAVSDPADTALRYWLRSGSQTLPMAETVVADRYRNRFADARTRRDRVGTLVDEGVERLDRDYPCVVLAVVPEIPGEMRLDASMGNQLREWLRRGPGVRMGGLPLIDQPQLTFGQRRAFVGDHPRANGKVVGISAELHTDGAAFIAVTVPANTNGGIFDIGVVDAVVGSLRLAARHAIDNAATGGEALAEARVLVVHPPHGQPSRLELYWQPIMGGGFVHADQIPHGRALLDVPPSQHTIDLDAIASSTFEWMVAARLVAGDLVQAFGLPETLQISPEGKLRWRYLGAGGRQLAAWAEREGIELDDAQVGL